MPVAETGLHQRGERDDRELTKRPAGGGHAKCQCAFPGRRLAAEGTEDRAEPRRRHADAAQHIARCEHDAFGRERDHEHADHIEDAAGGNGPCGAETIREVADKRRECAHQQHRQCVGKGPQLAPNMEVGCDRLLKDAKALARAAADGQNDGSANNGYPEAALLRLGNCSACGHRHRGPNSLPLLTACGRGLSRIRYEPCAGT
jgi:hypothetical protein